MTKEQHHEKATSLEENSNTTESNSSNEYADQQSNNGYFNQANNFYNGRFNQANAWPNGGVGQDYSSNFAGNTKQFAGSYNHPHPHYFNPAAAGNYVNTDAYDPSYSGNYGCNFANQAGFNDSNIPPNSYGYQQSASSSYGNVPPHMNYGYFNNQNFQTNNGESFNYGNGSYGQYSNQSAPCFDYNQLMELYNDFVQGKTDPMKVANFFATNGSNFWKGAIVGAAITFLLTNDSVKSSLSEMLSSIFGSDFFTSNK